MSMQDGVELNVVSAEWNSDYQLEIGISDGLVRKVDFGPF
ncbi:hypothetical protein SCARR_02097 [Pontiella sulfatireligans]|uniref:PepSY domain-containing protein n=1 Tax=Pontiella sulfatireligans TaxID=2750658 RepID=A0A6C2UKU3_9BACT|nr:hypothetical protein SCARR_02097 [Pontiella sulfatireligans]